jgi:hypothetical protein
MEENKSANTLPSLIDEDLIAGLENDLFLKDNIKYIVLNKFLQKKIYHLLWHIFHSFSVMYPENPTEEEKSRTKTFINKIATDLYIICYSCSKNKDTLIKTYDIDLAVSSRLNIIHFFCNYHKEVNIKYRPSIININAKYDPDLYTTDFIIKRYTTDDYISFIESNYNLNLYKLFQSDTMDSFFQLFYDFTKQFYRLEVDKYDLQINLKISAI